MPLILLFAIPPVLVVITGLPFTSLRLHQKAPITFQARELSMAKRSRIIVFPLFPQCATSSISASSTAIGGWISSARRNESRFLRGATARAINVANAALAEHDAKARYRRSAHACSTTLAMELRKIRDILGDHAALLDHQCRTIAASSLSLLSPSYVDDVVAHGDRSLRAARALQRLPSHRRLASIGYVSILPLDQGIEHSAGGTVRTEPVDVRSRERRAACHRVRQVRGGPNLRRARHGREQDPLRREDQPGRAEIAHEHPRATARRQHPPALRHVPSRYRDDRGFNDPVLKNVGRTHKNVYTDVATDNPVDIARHRVVNCYVGRSSLSSSGSAAGDNDMRDAVIDQRATGMGLIAEGKAFEKPVMDGADMPSTIREAFPRNEVRVA